PRLHLVVESITNERRLAELIEQADDIYHLAAVVGVRLVLAEPARTVATNLHGTEALLRLGARRSKPLFLPSSREKDGDRRKVPLNEEDEVVAGPPQSGRWIYAWAKLQAESLALSYHRSAGLPVVAARFFNVVGPRQVGRHGMVLPRFVSRALAGQ